MILLQLLYRASLIDELDGTMILKRGDGLTAEEIKFLNTVDSERLAEIVQLSKRKDVVGLIMECWES